MNRNLQNFRTYNLAKGAYQACVKLKLPYHLKDQLLRSTSSVALNLAEGSARRTTQEKYNFYSIAMGSIREAQSIMDLASLTNSEAEKAIDETSASLYKLLQHYSQKN